MESISFSTILLTLIVVPFVVSIAAYLAAPRLERKIASVSESYRQRSEDRKKRDLALFTDLSAQGLLNTFIFRCLFRIVLRLFALLIMADGAIIIALYPRRLHLSSPSLPGDLTVWSNTELIVLGLVTLILFLVEYVLLERFLGWRIKQVHRAFRYALRDVTKLL